MIYKIFSLVVLMVLFLGLRNVCGQDNTCDYIDDISAAVTEIVQIADDQDMRVPFGLTFQTERLEAICDGSATFPCPAVVIVDRLTTLVVKMIDGTFVCKCWPDEIPEDFTDALKNLLAVLEGDIE